MPCSAGTVAYTVQSGDTLYRIASMFNTTIQAILLANPGINPNVLYIGQQICVPMSQAVAQIANQPVIVNNVDINTGTYPVLNYNPPNAQYPYIYVPIAEFSRVGAKVSWDESKQLLTVDTDYYKLKSDNEKFKSLMSPFTGKWRSTNSIDYEIMNSTGYDVVSFYECTVEIDYLLEVNMYMTRGRIQNGYIIPLRLREIYGAGKFNDNGNIEFTIENEIKVEISLDNGKLIVNYSGGIDAEPGVGSTYVTESGELIYIGELFANEFIRMK